MNDAGRPVMQSVLEIPDFPFATFEEFNEACAAQRVHVWTSDRPEARDAVWTKSERLYFWIGSASPAWIAAGFAADALIRRDAWLLAGAIASMLGWITASPNMNLIDGCFSYLACFAALIGAVALHRGELIAASLGGFAAFTARSVSLAAAHMAIRAFMIESEASFLWLYKLGAVQGVFKIVPPEDDTAWPPPPSTP